MTARRHLICWGLLVPGLLRAATFLDQGLQETNAPPAGAAAYLEDLIISLPEDPRALQTDAPAPSILQAPPLFSLAGEATDPAESRPPLPLLNPDIHPELAGHMAQARRYLAANQMYLASREFWRAARQNPALPEPGAGLAATMLLAGDHLHAAALLEPLSRAHPEHPDLRFNLAAAYYGLGRHQEAIALLRDLLTEDPEPAKVHYNIAMNRLALQDHAGALESLIESHECNPDNPFASLALARLYAREGKAREMLTWLAKAMDLLPPDQHNLHLAAPDFLPYRQDPEFRALWSRPQPALEPDPDPTPYLVPLSPLPRR